MAEQPRRVVVIGGGAAGTAAAWAAQRAGARVTLLCARSGATALYSGALDRVPWQFGHVDRSVAEPDLVAFAAALGCWRLGTEPCMLATASGQVRPARGRDGALLDLAPFAGRSVAVLGVARREFDGHALAAAANASAWARETGTTFQAVAIDGALQPAESSFGAFDLARALDEPKRAEKFARDLARATAGHAAWLVGPWLGVESEVAERVAGVTGVPVGECLSEPGGSAGARFDVARDRLLAGLEVDVDRTGAAALCATDVGVTVRLANELAIDADAAVLATGGVAAGGIVLDPSRPRHGGGACFHLALDADLPLFVDGASVESVSTLHGVDFAAVGAGVLERVGVDVRDGAVTRLGGVFAAGDVVAGRPRTVLEAAATGLLAGRCAAGAAR